VTEPITLTNGALPGAGYLHLTRPVPPACRLTLSPNTPYAETVPVHRCTDDQPPMVMLGHGDAHADRVVLARAHAAGTPVRIEGRPAGLMLRQSVSLTREATTADNEYCGFVFNHPSETDLAAASWRLSLPPQPGEWVIGEGVREVVLADACRLRDELNQAITALVAAGKDAA
jgi:hypothetical protein